MSLAVSNLDENVRRWLEYRFHITATDILYKGAVDSILTRSTLNLLGQMGQNISTLDLSFSSLESDLRHLEGLSGLRNLVLDNCRLGDWLILPKMHGLATLSLNKNNLSDLWKFVHGVSWRLPNLRHLSFLGNPFSPHPSFNYGDCARKSKGNSDLTAAEESYRSFRLMVLCQLPDSLRFLDDRQVSEAEKFQADRVREQMAQKKNTWRLWTEGWWKHNRERPQTLTDWSEEGGKSKCANGEDPGSLGGLNRFASALNRLKTVPSTSATKDHRSVTIKMQRLKKQRKKIPSSSSTPPDASSSPKSVDGRLDEGEDEEALEATPSSVLQEGQGLTAGRPSPPTEMEDCQAQHLRDSEGRAFYGRLKYRYEGKHSEGNVFISNGDL